MRLGSKAVDTDVSGRGTGTNVVRGGLVLAVALLVGGYLFSRIDDPGTISGSGQAVDAGTDAGAELDPAGAEATVDDTGAAMGDTGATGAADATTATNPDGSAMTSVAGTSQADDTATTASTAPALREPAQVTVIVLNGSEESGIAALGTEKATTAGYKTLVAKNADETQGSAIYYTDGFEAEATALAQVYGPALETLVEPLDTEDPPSSEIDGADIIVVLGTDGLIPVS